MVIAKVVANLFSKPVFKQFFLHFLVLPFYQIYLFNKKIFNRLYAPALRRNKILFLFTKRYLIHLTIIVIALLTLTANLNAYETTPTETGDTSILSSLVSFEDDLGLIEEEGPLPETKRITSYLDQTGVTSPAPQMAEGTTDETLPATVAGGSAVVKPIISPAEAEIRQRDKIVYYTVEEGDNINYIAKVFGLNVSTILWANNLTSYSIIRPGDKITVLPVNGLTHKVAKGESLTKIAKKYDADSEDIIDYNKLASADDIVVGETLIIPYGTRPQPVYSVRSIWVPPSSSAISGTGGMLWPNVCRRITKYFGWSHSGLDIACPFGSPIYAAGAGTVIRAQGGWNGGYGIYVIIDHGGIQTLYGHLSKLYVRVGDTVNKGQPVGAEGSTGRSTGPHVHFEVRTGGVRRNPLSYIR